MARQQLIVDTKTPAACIGSSSPYVVSYAPNLIGSVWDKKGADIDGEATSDYSGWSVSLSSDGNVVAIGAPYRDSNGFVNNGHVRVYAWNGTIWEKRGGDINGEAANDESGYSVSLSNDGSIVVIGAKQNNGTVGTNRGHVRVYQYDVTKTTADTNQASSDFGPVGWRRLGADIDGEATGDNSGYSVSLSSDGLTVAIGARYNDSNNFVNNGHVRVYQYDADKNEAVTDQTASDFGPIGWNRLGADIDGEARYDESGYSVSLSSDGSRVAIGAYRNDSAGTDAGHVRVYQYDVAKATADTNQASSDFGPVGWRRLGADIDGEAGSDHSGWSVSLSSDGSIVAIGAKQNNGTVGTNRGHVRVYRYDADKNEAVTDQAASNFGPIGWNRLGADIDGEAASDNSGYSVSLSSDGSIVAIGATHNDSNGVYNKGHVRVYHYNAGKDAEVTDQTASDFGPIGWNRLGADIDGEASSDLSGWSVSLSSDGRTVAIGAPYRDSNGFVNNGHVRVYRISSPPSKVPQVGDWAVAEHKETHTGADLSTYTYRVTHVADGDTLVLKFVSATTPEDGSGVGWGDIGGGIFANKSLDISSEQTKLKGIAFSSDGLKLSTVGQISDLVHQYDLTVAWDVTSASYNGDSMSVSSEESAPQDLTFSSDGLKMYIVGDASDKIHQYDLTVAWDVTSASYSDSGDPLSVLSQEGDTKGVTFKTDGTSVYICGYSGNVHQYHLFEDWDVTGGSLYIGAMSTSSECANTQALEFSPDGIKLYVLDGSSDKIYQYNLTVAWDITSGSYSGKNLSTSPAAGSPAALRFSSDGTKLYIGDLSDDTVYQFSFDNFIDDSPCDLCDGTGSPGYCPIAPHVIKRDLGGMFMMLLD